MTDVEQPFGDRATGRELAPAMTRSEEQVRVTHRSRVRERVRLVKHVVTEQVTVTVRREELRVERETVGEDDLDTDAAGPAGTLGQADDLVIVLHEERVRVDAVPVERVRVHVETVVEQVAISTDRRVEDVRLVQDGPALAEREAGGQQVGRA